MAFTDPPYNVNYDQDKSPQGKPKHSKGRILNDRMNAEAFQKFITATMKNLLNYTKGGVYVCMGCKEWPALMEAFESQGGHWSSTIIWKKSNFVMGRQDYHRKFEPVLYGWKEGNKRYFLNDRSLSDVWEIDKPARNDLHPTQKPVELCVTAIRNSSRQGDIVLDLFGGSGSTLIACEQLNRKCYMMELDPKYCSVIIERWEQVSGAKARKVS